MNREESKKELISVLWNGADVLRSKMDANDYKNYLLSFVFYKYLSDRFLLKVYDLLNDCEPETIEEAQQAYEEAYKDESAGDLLAIGGFNVYTSVKMITDGGPAHKTDMILTWMYYKAFGTGEFGYSAALSFITSLVLAVLAVIQFRLMQNKDS